MRAVVPPALARGSEKYRFSPGVAAAGLLFVSGQVGRDADGHVIEDPTEQYVAAFECIGSVLAEAGAGFADVVDMTSFHTSFDGFELFTAVRERYLVGPVFPAWTAVGVTALAVPGILAEVRCTAVLPR